MSSNKYKLSPKVMAILEPLVEFELYQSSKYVQAANVANKLGFFLAEAYYIGESKDERKHAMIHYDYITGRGSDFQMPGEQTTSYDPTNSNKSIVAVTDAQAFNANLKVLALPWSAPAWMKNNNAFINTSCDGNALGAYLNTSLNIPDVGNIYQAYANYFVTFIQNSKLPVSIVSLQNEPHNCSTNYPTMLMTPTQQGTLAVALRKALDNAHLDSVKIMGWDHNWFDYNSESYSDSQNRQSAAQFPLTLLNLDPKGDINYIGYHHYGKGRSDVQSALYLQAKKEKKNIGIYMTEATGTCSEATGPQCADSNPAPNLVWETKNDLIDPLTNWAQASLYWNLALDPNGADHVGGCSNCRGMITVNSATSYDLNEDYYYWAQFSKFIDPGAHRISSTTAPGSSLDLVAFQNPSPDNSIVVVALNTAPLP